MQHRTTSQYFARPLAGWVIAAWLLLVLVLSQAVDPVTTAIGCLLFTGVAIARRRRMVVFVALCVALGALVADPLFTALSGGATSSEFSSVEYRITNALRLSFQVLSVLIVVLLPSDASLLWLSRWSSRTAIVAALWIRCSQLLRADVRAARLELDSAGDMPSGIGGRAGNRNSWAFVGDIVMTGVVERTYDAVAALELRGFGSTTSQRLHGVGSGGDELNLRAWWCVVVGTTVVAIGVLMGLVQVAVVMLLMTTVALLRASRITGNRATPAVGCIQPQFGSPQVVAQGEGKCAPDLVVSQVSVFQHGSTTPLIHGISFTAPAGTTTVIRGSDEQSTGVLCAVIDGTLPFVHGGRVEGTIIIGGVDATQVAPHIRRRDIGSLPAGAERHIVRDTVRAEIEFPAFLAGMTDRQVLTALQQCCDRLPIAHLLHRNPTTLSGGELQLVMCATVLVTDPAAIVAHNPGVHLDSRHTKVLWRALQTQFSGARRTLIIGVDGDTPIPVPIVHEVQLYQPQSVHGTGLADTPSSADIPCSEATPELEVTPELEAIAGTAENPAVSPLEPTSPVRLMLPPVDIAAVPCDDPAWRTLVRGCELYVPAGALCAVTGANGCGKSTLLRALAGFGCAPGVARFDGRVLTGAQPEAMTRAYVSQHSHHWVGGTTVGDVVRQAAIRRGVSAHDAQHSLVEGGLDAWEATHPHDAPAAVRQRLAIVMRTLHRPALWILDEPTHSLDDRAVAWLINRIRNHCTAGGVVVVASHDARIVSAANLQLVIEHGMGRVSMPPRANHDALPNVPRQLHVPKPTFGGAP